MLDHVESTLLMLDSECPGEDMIESTHTWPHGPSRCGIGTVDPRDISKQPGPGDSV